MATLFTKIIAGEIPCYKVAEDNKHLAFLDINPNAKGHTLCIPKQEIDQIFDMESQDYTDLLQFSHRVAKAIKKTVSCKRVGMAVIGLEVPHAHVHLIPLNEMDEMRFQNKVKLEPAEFESIASLIRENL